jgi:hypothetical protein
VCPTLALDFPLGFKVSGGASCRAPVWVRTCAGCMAVGAWVWASMASASASAQALLMWTPAIQADWGINFAAARVYRDLLVLCCVAGGQFAVVGRWMASANELGWVEGVLE